MMRITETVKQLIIINVIFFIGSYLVGPAAQTYLVAHSVCNDQFHYWQLITRMFMHAGFLHLLFNMFALFSFGGLLEEVWGPRKFIFFYLSCGLGAAAMHLGINYLEISYYLKDAADLNLSSDAIHQILNVDFSDGAYFKGDLFQKEIVPIISKEGKLQLLNSENFSALFQAAIANHETASGASGAIYGILVAFAFIVPNAELMMMFVPIPIKAKYFVPGILALDLFLGVKGQSIFGGATTDNVGHFAHLGGALIGFIMMWYWKKNEFNNNRWN
ncbi:rhomboid family intramembrane serine protease [Flavobacterium sp. DG1-102-2]|uniref:rhomboid family intramembrane serine protease n=1 Tax=Flavobacterium sp. DG1-102-2 TaxID=3081663 RepID=UPI00294A05B3|nr:rhomboid family intramembrane serine protease [Flavobacterium sp. DG1-102-2]MDV6170184.1 rhomboid family intramembrane serine protease [Flavobacterium sp. DG1-102-2]